MITSPRNSRLKDIRRLRRCKADAALLEGPHLVGEAIRAGIALGEVLATPAFLASALGRELVSALPHPPLEVEPRVLESITDADSPRGIVAVASLPRHGIAGVPVVAGGVYVYADGLQDPGNLGALARVAEASGATALCLAAGSAHPNHPRALRASAGSLLRLPVAVEVSPEALDTHLGGCDPRWLALVPRGGHDLWATPLEGTRVLALGAEGPGLSEPLRRRATLELTIPLAAPVESLNATVAAALVLFELARRARS